MLIDKAKSFIQTMYSELKYNANEIENRMKEIEQEINLTGSYTHTYEELSYGAKMAWRNSNRCIGRLFWDSLNVEDARDVCDEKEFIKFIHTHIKEATNGGKIKPYITIFSPEDTPKIYNNQSIRYAGYENAGDPSEKRLLVWLNILVGKVKVQILIFYL